MPAKLRSAVMLGRRGGSRHTPAQIRARRDNGLRSAGQPRRLRQPCLCGHGKAKHRWQRNGLRSGCKICFCPQFVRDVRY